MTKKAHRKGTVNLKRYVPYLLAALLVLTLAASLLGWSTLVMPRRYPLSTTARAAFGSGGDILLIDRGKTAIELLDAGGVLRDRLNGGTPDGFYYAEQLARTEDGTLYVADRAYRESGGAAETVERVVEFYKNGSGGSTARVVWEQALTGSSSAEQGAAIYELQLYDGAVWFLRSEDYGLGLYRFRPGGETAELVRRVYCGDAVNDASVDLSTGTLAIATRRGYVRVLHEEEQLWITVPSDTERLMPQSISARNGSVWFSDVYADRVCRFSALRPQDGFETAFQSETRIIDVAAGADGTTALATDGAGFYRYRIGAEGFATTYTGEVRFARFPLTLLLRGCLAVAAAISLWLLWKLLKRAARLFRAESALRVLLVVAAAASVSAFVAYSLMNDLFAQEDDTLVENMRLFAGTVVQSVDPEDLRELEWETDYGGSAFLRVRRPMDGMLALARAENGSYSYALYRLDGERQVRLILNSADSVMCGQPYDMAGQEYIAEAQRTGKSYALRTQDADGSRIAVLVPVTGAGGGDEAPFAVLEVSVDLSLRTRERMSTVWNMVLNTACATAVVVMLILEGIFLLSFLERKRTLAREGSLRRDKAPDGPDLVPVRTLMFLSYVADSMQDIFIAVLVSRLYAGGLPLPDGVAVALPMSGQLLMMAVCSALTGRVAERLGTRRVMTGGVLLQLCGFLCCLVTGTYGGIMAGKLLIGAGMGTIYVTCNTVAVSGASEASIAGAFAGVSAGTLSGITIGAGLSSVFLSIGGWRLVYGVGAALLLCALWLSLSSENIMPGKADDSVADAGFSRFFFNRRVLGFFALVLVPFMMALSYREYFFPLFAESQGIGENHIGQLFMLCGMLTIYVGPRLSAFIIRVLGPRWSIVLASGGMGAALLLFVLRPVVWAVLAGLLIMSLTVSFAYTCQYTYFEELPDSFAYGPGKAMGVYSVFESLGQVLGPVVYGTLLSFGWQTGIGAFLGLMAALLIFFVLLMPGSRNSREETI